MKAGFTLEMPRYSEPIFSHLIGKSESIAPSHITSLKEAFTRAGKSAWSYFAPFLCCYHLPPSRQVLVSGYGDSLLILIQQKTLNLMLPPLPMNETLLTTLVEEHYRTNQMPLRILWLDEEDARLILNNNSIKADIKVKDTEYLYNPKLVSSTYGKEYRDVRKRVNKFEREHHPTFREFNLHDMKPCLNLLKRWRINQGRRRNFLLDWGYTKAAVQRYAEFKRHHLQGWCVEAEGEVVAFAMAGPISANTASFFIAKSDTTMVGLSEYLRVHVHSALSDYDRVNDAGDLELPGLRRHKMKFRPAELAPVYTAELSIQTTA